MRAAIAGLCIVSLLAAGCVQVSPWRAHARPWTPGLVTGASGVRATQSDGTRTVLVDAYLDADATYLRGTRVPAGDEAPVAIPTDQLTLLETKRVEPLRVLANVGLGVLYSAVILVVLVGLNPPVGVYG